MFNACRRYDQFSPSVREGIEGGRGRYRLKVVDPRMRCCRSNSMYSECDQGTHWLLSRKSEFFCRKLSSAGGMKGITTTETR